MSKVQRALLSVSDKTELVEFARGLHELGVELVSTGGTAAEIAAAGIPVKQVSDLTGFPEMLDGRVKTLHPVVHGGLLARRGVEEHMQALGEHGIGTIDLLCVNLYPFLATVLKPNVTLEDAIENIDIGGPAMVRSASKNHESVTVVVDPADYESILAELNAEDGATKPETRKVLAAKAFAHTARYDAMISRYLREQFQPGEWPKELTLGYTLAQQCRYGENPHQHAAFYREIGVREPCVATAKQINGKELSFNNIFDLNAALETVKEFPEGEAAVIIKHANPCGAALGSTLAEAFRKAREGDPISAFGGILALNRPVDVATAEEITGKSTFFEAIIAPGYAPDAIPILVEKKKWGANLRLLEVGDLRGWHTRAWGQDMKKVVGGVLIQDRDLLEQSAGALKVVTTRKPTEEELAELLFAWRVMRHVKSNAIAFSRDLQIIGVGAGQMNRVQSVQLAVKQAEAHAGGAQGGVMASDAFFPFPDGPTAAADAGITAIIQPGGSVKDQETIDLCNERGIAMVFTGARHFLH